MSLLPREKRKRKTFCIFVIKKVFNRKALSSRLKTLFWKWPSLHKSLLEGSFDLSFSWAPIGLLKSENGVWERGRRKRKTCQRKRCVGGEGRKRKRKTLFEKGGRGKRHTFPTKHFGVWGRTWLMLRYGMAGPARSSSESSLFAYVPLIGQNFCLVQHGPCIDPFWPISAGVARTSRVGLPFLGPNSAPQSVFLPGTRFQWVFKVPFPPLALLGQRPWHWRPLERRKRKKRRRERRLTFAASPMMREWSHLRDGISRGERGESNTREHLFSDQLYYKNL